MIVEGGIGTWNVHGQERERESHTRGSGGDQGRSGNILRKQITQLNTCSAEKVLPSLGLRKNLHIGKVKLLKAKEKTTGEERSNIPKVPQSRQ